MSSDPVEKVGIIVVHGIGEQRRFEHLDAQVREMIAALRARKDTQVTASIATVRVSGFEADQALWHCDPSVVLHVADGETGKNLEVHVHEVWWADVNEPYSLGKQLRFWAWTLAIWTYPSKPGTTLGTADRVRMPSNALRLPFARELWVRARLFGIAFIAVLAAASIGMFSFIAERVFKLKPPDLLRVFVNYVAGVKLYNQKRRFGSGFPGKENDFLDTIGEPPRVSVRRRMIEALMDVAGQPYARWYVLGHSLGSVVAFNGLMETAYAWPGCVSSYPHARPGFGMRPSLEGPAKADWPLPAGKTVPQRPVGLASNVVAYRPRIFANFHGLITIGSPLEKFAAIWPARVPITKEPAFRSGTFWLNVYDPVDPVSGVLRSFGGSAPDCCPAPCNIGYSASSILLLAHFRYLRGPHGKGTFGDGLAELLVTGNHARISAINGGRWFGAQSLRRWRRSMLAWCWWVAAVGALTLAGALIYPSVGQVAEKTAVAIWNSVGLHSGLWVPLAAPVDQNPRRRAE